MSEGLKLGDKVRVVFSLYSNVSAGNVGEIVDLCEGKSYYRASVDNNKEDKDGWYVEVDSGTDIVVEVIE